VTDVNDPSGSARPEPPDRPPRRRATRVLTVIGVLFLVTGLSCLGYVGYQLWGTNIASHKAYDKERSQLKRSWKKPPQHDPGKHKTKKYAPVPGDAIALMSIPSIGLKEAPVLEGTGLDVLARGIGHYRKTAYPGQVGNFAVAGHRITHGEPFSKLLQMNQGDKIIVETRTSVYTYVLDDSPRNLTVEDTEGWVIEPVPGKPHAEPTKRLITLTTCQDLFHSPDRSVGFGHLAASKKK
jgi:sortase A